MLTTEKANALEGLFRSILTLLDDHNGNVNVFKIFESTPNVIYGYETYNRLKDPYIGKSTYTRLDKNAFPFDFFRETIEYSLKHNSDIKWCNGTNGSAHFRLRFANESWTLKQKEEAIKKLSAEVMSRVDMPESKNKVSVAPKCDTPKVNNKKGEKMGDFSLSNLKDAVIDKVTSLDRKTITILAIIALLLLIVGKYQTIKDILIGIKDKVKRSKNFKAMVEDGTNAINGLKKIVGIKDKGAKTDEA